jgi:PhnB protein
MKNVHPYLNFNGNTEEAFNFYKSVFGGEFISVMRFSDIPGDEEMPTDIKDKIMHISLKISPNTTLMGTDAIEPMAPKVTMGNNSYIYLDTESREEADKLFNQLSEGGKIVMPLEDQFWGDYYSDFIDKFGVCWMIGYSVE